MLSRDTKATVAASAWEEVDLYRFFAFTLGQPAVERFEWLQRPDLDALLAGLWDMLECEGVCPRPGTYADYQEYESTYVAEFEVGLPAAPVPLQESAHDTTAPPQDTVLENVFFYEVLGLKAAPARYAPDHLVTQLEFLSAVRFMRRRTPQVANREPLARLERDYLERHVLNWLPRAEEKLARRQPPVFPLLLQLLHAFARRQHADLRAVGSLPG
jgi:DMSO reductase family type II enzyme chaperone